VESEKKEPANIKKLFYNKAIIYPDADTDDQPPLLDAFSKRVSELLEQEPI
jgi:DNA gyrase/topoisomerase IV subunit B